MARNGEEGQYKAKSDQVKRSSASRKKYKKRRDAILIGSILVFVCVVAVLSLNVFLKVSEIRVENEAIRYTDDQIVTASGIRVEDSLLGIKKKSVCARIEKQLPYVGEAHIGVRLPDTVVIGVTYTEAKLCVAQEDGYVLLDRTGKVLQTGVAVPSDYIAEVTGATLTEAVPGEKARFEEEDMFSYVTGLAQAFEENGITSVTAYDFSKITEIMVEINYNTDVKLGSISNAVKNLKFGKEVIDRTLTQYRGGDSKVVIDLTEGDKAYVRTQEDIDAAAEAASIAANAESETALSPETSPDVPSTIGENTASPEQTTAAPQTTESASAQAPQEGEDAIG